MNRERETPSLLPIDLETLYEEDEVAEAAVPYTAKRANDLDGATWTR